MPDLRQTRQKLKIALATMALIDVAAVAVYFSPLVGSQSSRRAELGQLWLELQLKTREIAPLRGLDKKIPVANQQIEEFYQRRLPQESSEIAENLGKVASENGVRIGSFKYSLKDPEDVGLRRVEIDADLAGDYLQLARFINALERDRMFFLVDGVQLGGAQAGVVRLNMKAETYLRTGAA